MSDDRYAPRFQPISERVRASQWRRFNDWTYLTNMNEKNILAKSRPYSLNIPIIPFLGRSHSPTSSHPTGAYMSLSKKIAAKLKADGITAVQAAKQAGITAITFKAVLAGKSVPNSRSVDKYAKFLGMSTDEVLAIAGSRKGKAKGKAKTAKAKKPGKRGRPPGKAKRGRPAGKAKRGRPPGKAKRGRPPGKAKAAKVPGRRGRPAKPGVPAGKVKAVGKQIARAQKVLDRLAVIVAKLG